MTSPIPSSTILKAFPKAKLTLPRPGQVWNEKAGGAEFDSEFEAFMNDMGGGAPKVFMPLPKF